MAKASTLKELLGEHSGAIDLSEVPFEVGLKLLEELTEKVESGTLPLEKSIVAYERGSHLVNHLRKLLSGAEEKLRLLQKGPEEN